MSASSQNAGHALHALLLAVAAAVFANELTLPPGVVAAEVEVEEVVDPQAAAEAAAVEEEVVVAEAAAVEAVGLVPSVNEWRRKRCCLPLMWKGPQARNQAF